MKMKKLIVVAILAVSISGIAQERKQYNRREKVELSPEQKTELQVKKLTLELDLNAKQQKEISEIMKKQQVKRVALRTEMKAKREEIKKRNADEKFAMINKNLDDRIALKSEMRKVLTPEQAERWEKMSVRKMEGKRKRMHKNKSTQK